MRFDSVEFCGGPMDGLRLVEGIESFSTLSDKETITVNDGKAQYKLRDIRNRVLCLTCISDT